MGCVFVRMCVFMQAVIMARQTTLFGLPGTAVTDGRHFCPECSRYFKTAQGLGNHRQVKHRLVDLPPGQLIGTLFPVPPPPEEDKSPPPEEDKSLPPEEDLPPGSPSRIPFCPPLRRPGRDLSR